MVSDFKTFAHKGCNIPAHFCLTSKILLVSVLLTASVQKFFVSCMRDFNVICHMSRVMRHMSHNLSGGSGINGACPF